MYSLPLRSVRFDPAPQRQLGWESVARCPSPRSVPLEREGSAVSAFASTSVPYHAVTSRAESAGATVLAIRIPHTLETMRLRRHSHSQSTQRKIADCPSTERCPIA
jgi:hypothetical protein